MKTPKKRTPKSSKYVQAPQTEDVTPKELRSALAYGRSLSDFEPLMGAERMLLHACRMGEIAVISGQRPEQATEENTVRAGFLRFLLLGGDHTTPIHGQGVRLKGAWIEDKLNLENTTAVSPVDCKLCAFTGPLILRRSTLSVGLFLQGSTVPGIWGDGLAMTGSVFCVMTSKLVAKYSLQARRSAEILNAATGSLTDRRATLFPPMVP